MQAKMMDLWLTHARRIGEVQLEQGDAALAGLIRSTSRVRIIGDTTLGRASTLRALRILAYEGADTSREALTGYLCVHVPIGKGMTPKSVMHRIVRRLYFTSVVLGLGELSELRSVVQRFRVSYLQTRGEVAETRNSTSRQSYKDEVSAGLKLSMTDLKLDLGGKLSASEEVALVEGWSAKLERAGLYEAEDNLVSDLLIMNSLESVVRHFTREFARKLPRSEMVREYYRAVYQPIYNETTPHIVRLAPVIVLDCPESQSDVLHAFVERASSLMSVERATIITIENSPSNGALRTFSGFSAIQEV